MAPGRSIPGLQLLRTLIIAVRSSRGSMARSFIPAAVCSPQPTLCSVHTHLSLRPSPQGLLAAAHGDLTTDDQFLCPTPHAIPNLPILKTEASISSGKERAPTDVTLVTQLSFERCAAGS